MLDKKMTLIKLVSKRQLTEESEIPLSEQMRIINDILEKEHAKRYEEELAERAKINEQLFNEAIYGKSTN
jgi:hypothetical protein